MTNYKIQRSISNDYVFCFWPQTIKLSSLATWIDVKVLVYIKGNYKIKLLQLSILFIYNYTITLKEKNLNNTLKKVTLS